MERIKMCAICGMKIAKYTCMNCGAFVCEDCFDKRKMLCINCARRA